MFVIRYENGTGGMITDQVIAAYEKSDTLPGFIEVIYKDGHSNHINTKYIIALGMVRDTDEDGR